MKKLLAIMSAMLMVVSLLAGCGGAWLPALVPAPAAAATSWRW